MNFEENKEPVVASASEANRRRGFILDKLRQLGKISFEDLTDHFSGLKRASIHQDVRVLSEMGFPVYIEREGNKGVIVQSTPHLPATKQLRQKVAKQQKSEIGRLVCGLVLGFRSEKPISVPDLADCITRDEILRQLDCYSAFGDNVVVKQKSADIRNYLLSYWEKHHRTIGIDAGTTTETVAELLKKVRCPDHSLGLGGLRIVTNSPSILSILSPPAISTEVIVLGGQLRKETEAITGELSRECIENWRLHLDVSIIGTTNLNFKDNDFGSDSVDESLTKSLFLSRSSLRCIVADSSKFDRYTISSFPFANIHGKSVDIFITDAAIKPEFIERLARQGIVLLKPDRDGTEVSTSEQGH